MGGLARRGRWRSDVVGALLEELWSLDLGTMSRRRRGREWDERGVGRGRTEGHQSSTRYPPQQPRSHSPSTFTLPRTRRALPASLFALPRSRLRGTHRTMIVEENRYLPKSGRCLDAVRRFAQISRRASGARSWMQLASSLGIRLCSRPAEQEAIECTRDRERGEIIQLDISGIGGGWQARRQDAFRHHAPASVVGRVADGRCICSSETRQT